MTVNALVGMPGSGKTLFMAWCANGLEASGYDIYANFNLHAIDYTHLDDVADFGDISGEKIAVFVDEIHRSGDARRSGSNMNILLTEDIMQYRKWGEPGTCHIYYSEQLWKLMDNRFRGICGRCYEPTIIGRLPEPGKAWLQRKPVRMRLRYFDFSDARRRFHTKSIWLISHDKWTADTYDTRERIGKFKDDGHIIRVDEMVERYKDVPLSKKAEFAAYIGREEGRRRTGASEAECRWAVNLILADRALQGT